MKVQMLKERMELLEIGEWLGYPRLGYGRSVNGSKRRSIPAGQPGWEKFAKHAHSTIVPTTLRIARVLKVNNVRPYNPSIREQAEGLPVVLPAKVIALDDPLDSEFTPDNIRAEVTRQKSKAAIRQQRFRDKRKAARA